MRFARVTGYVVARNNGLELTVTLDDGRRVETIRAGRVVHLGRAEQRDDLPWQADQYTQETIGNELALLGWEAVAVEPAAAAVAGAGVSAAYLVRKTGGPA